jgi:preprotein translocase subunit SecA
VLEGADLHEQIRSMVDEVIASYVAVATADGYPEEWDLEKMWRAFKQLFPITLKIDTAIEEAGGDKSGLTTDLLTELVQENAQEAYDRREAELTPDLMREIERRVVLSVLDRKWREHLYEMDYLREGIGLRAMAQRDPLVEYQREGYDMFSSMMDGIKEESVGNLFNLQFEIQENPIVEEVGAGAQLAFGGTLPGVTTAGVPAQAAPAPAAQAPAPAAPARPARPVPPAPPAPVAPPPAFGKKPGTAGGQQAGGRHRARNDGRGHATAAGRGQTAARSGGTHAASSAPQDVEEVTDTVPESTGPQPVMPVGLEPNRPRHLQYSAPTEDGGVEMHGDAAEDPYATVGRNDLCPCGSGRKYKRCHGSRNS